MTRPTTTARVALALVVLLAAGGVFLARRTPPVAVTSSTGTPLPELARGPLAPPVRAAGWLNSAPLDAAGFATKIEGKVVVYDFWTFGCINCLHTLPFVEGWQRRYAADGLVVVGVHTPEFAAERDPVAVARFVRDHGLTFPVALDPDRVVWDAFDVHAWPTFHVHDRSGHRRLVHIGEGGEAEVEDVLRALLGVDPNAPRAPVVRDAA